MKITTGLSVALLGLSSMTAEAATVWLPTNADVDFLQFNISGLSTNGGTLALFDDTDFGGTALVIGAAGGQVTFTPSGSDWFANYGSDSILLSTTMQFSLGMSWDGGATWFSDASYMSLPAGGSPDSYIIRFVGSNPGYVEGTTVAVDLMPVPMPAAVWLFGSGLIGLVGIARRRESGN